jgi:type II secretory pathway pseudopilin PulG
LIELLVVIAVIGILASLVLGGVSRAKARAHAVGCMNNVRQLGLAFRLYVDDHDRLPKEETAEVFMDGGWLVYLARYYQNPKLRLCPATRDPNLGGRLNRAAPRLRGTADSAYRHPVHSTAARPFDLVKPWGGEVFAGSYALNEWLVEMWNPGPEFHPFFFRSESVITQPWRTPVFADSTISGVDPFNLTPPKDLYDPFSWGTSWLGLMALARHGGSGPARASMPVTPGQPLGLYFNNVACYDGHVERVKLQHLAGLVWHRRWEPIAIWPW